MDYGTILDCTFTLLNLNGTIYSSSNQFSHHQDLLWNYIKEGMVVEYKQNPYVVQQIDRSAHLVILCNDHDHSVIRVPFFSNDVKINSEVLLEVYQDWVNDLRYGDVVDIEVSNNYTKGYYIGENGNAGYKSFQVNSGYSDLGVSITTAEPSKVSLPNTLFLQFTIFTYRHFGSYFPLKRQLFYLSVPSRIYESNNNSILSDREFALGPIACHNEYPFSQFLIILHMDFSPLPICTARSRRQAICKSLHCIIE